MARTQRSSLGNAHKEDALNGAARALAPHASPSDEKNTKQREDFLAEHQRAEDILLGAIGFGEDATLISLRIEGSIIEGVVRFSDGDIIPFSYEESLSPLEEWALSVLKRSVLKDSDAAAAPSFKKTGSG